jgi:hypothetical protein
VKHSPLTDPKLVLVFAQAPTGLGHLRVTDALYHGLPEGASALLLSSQDKSLTYTHRLTSIHPWLRAVMEFTQNGLPEAIFSKVFRWALRRSTKMLEEQLQTMLEQHVLYPKTLLVVATHFGLAHQLAAIKDQFAKKYKVNVILVVTVTDDSPQRMWAVGGADLIFVPSERTRRSLDAYHRTQNMAPSQYVVLPYMVSPRLGEHITAKQLSVRRQQLSPIKQTSIHVSIPISGAAVQLLYVSHYIQQLRILSDRFIFHVVARQSAHTREFLSGLIGQQHIDLMVSESDREVIELYEKLYAKEIISVELTKPSEQSFKALFHPRQRGGSVMLFSEPVGRQERDNINFLTRHDLMPTESEQKELLYLARKNKPIHETLLKQAVSWRALKLPFRSQASVQFTWWALEQGLLEAMANFTRFKKDPELGSNGVALLWETLEEYLATVRP